MRPLRIGTWNLCLGLPSKKDLVIETLKQNDIDICCLQETEIVENFPIEILSCKDYCFEAEKNTSKKRVGVYLNKKLKYNRRDDLEENNRHLIIIDLELGSKVRIITLYRSFRPPECISTSKFFQRQLIIAKRNLTPK